MNNKTIKKITYTLAALLLFTHHHNLQASQHNDTNKIGKLIWTGGLLTLSMLTPKKTDKNNTEEVHNGIEHNNTILKKNNNNTNMQEEPTKELTYNKSSNKIADTKMQGLTIGIDEVIEDLSKKIQKNNFNILDFSYNLLTMTGATTLLQYIRNIKVDKCDIKFNRIYEHTDDNINKAFEQALKEVFVSGTDVDIIGNPIDNQKWVKRLEVNWLKEHKHSSLQHDNTNSKEIRNGIEHNNKMLSDNNNTNTQKKQTKQTYNASGRRITDERLTQLGLNIDEVINHLHNQFEKTDFSLLDFSENYLTMEGATKLLTYIKNRKGNVNRCDISFNKIYVPNNDKVSGEFEHALRQVLACNITVDITGNPIANINWVTYFKPTLKDNKTIALLDWESNEDESDYEESTEEE